MLNYDHLIERLQLLMNENELTASSFADKIGVQRSSISHILSGRNKPSLDFIAKIEANFTEVSFHWLLTGEELPIPSPTASPPQLNKESKPAAKDTPSVSEHQPMHSSPKQLVDLIYIFSDGSFQRFHANS